MSNARFLLPLLLLVLPAASQARDWSFDSSRSTLGFTGTYSGATFEGKFGKFDATIRYDEGDISTAKFEATIDLASVDTASSERNDSLKGEDFFDTRKFPQAHFVTAAFAKTADGSVEAKGTLTIRDKTQPVTLKVKFAATGDKATLDVDTVLRRTDFGLGLGKDWSDIGADVPVHGHLALTGK